MPQTENISSLPAQTERLLQVPLACLRPHPANANLMSEERLKKLSRNIEQEERYPPLIVRSHPEGNGLYQILDGHQRFEVLRRLGHEQALCFPWECDDATALVLLATLNRLEGEDVPVKRAELLQQLTELISPADLALLLPEDAGAIEDTLALLQFDSEGLLAELTEAAERSRAVTPRSLTFAVTPEDEALIERAISLAGAQFQTSNKRGRALALIARTYLEVGDA